MLERQNEQSIPFSVTCIVAVVTYLVGTITIGLLIDSVGSVGEFIMAPGLWLARVFSWGGYIIPGAIASLLLPIRNTHLRRPFLYLGPVGVLFLLTLSLWMQGVFGATSGAEVGVRSTLLTTMYSRSTVQTVHWILFFLLLIEGATEYLLYTTIYQSRSLHSEDSRGNKLGFLPSFPRRERAPAPQADTAQQGRRDATFQYTAPEESAPLEEPQEEKISAREEQGFPRINFTFPKLPQVPRLHSPEFIPGVEQREPEDTFTGDKRVEVMGRRQRKSTPPTVEYVREGDEPEVMPKRPVVTTSIFPAGGVAEFVGDVDEKTDGEQPEFSETIAYPRRFATNYIGNRNEELYQQNFAPVDGNGAIGGEGESTPVDDSYWSAIGEEIVTAERDRQVRNRYKEQLESNNWTGGATSSSSASSGAGVRTASSGAAHGSHGGSTLSATLVAENSSAGAESKKFSSEEAIAYGEQLFGLTRSSKTPTTGLSVEPVEVSADSSKSVKTPLVEPVEPVQTTSSLDSDNFVSSLLDNQDRGQRYTPPAVEVISQEEQDITITPFVEPIGTKLVEAVNAEGDGTPTVIDVDAGGVSGIPREKPVVESTAPSSFGGDMLPTLSVEGDEETEIPDIDTIFFTEEEEEDLFADESPESASTQDDNFEVSLEKDEEEDKEDEEEYTFSSDEVGFDASDDSDSDASFEDVDDSEDFDESDDFSTLNDDTDESDDDSESFDISVEEDSEEDSEEEEDSEPLATTLGGIPILPSLKGRKGGGGGYGDDLIVEDELSGGMPETLDGAVEPEPEPEPKPKKVNLYKNYRVPTDNLLNPHEDDEYWIIDPATENRGDDLVRTLKDFGVEVELTGIQKGPVVTMFEILPAPGVKVARIASLQDNIAMELQAAQIRIVAPIPGKKAVGVEVPNADRSLVSFVEMCKHLKAQAKKMAIPVVLGKDVTGDAQLIDLTKTPHLLIAGATGSGKSVCVNTLICSILLQRSPREVKLIMVDPKRVELGIYNNIPHMLTPVITDSKKAFKAIQYGIFEMERRYSLLESIGGRNIKEFNNKVEREKLATEKLPHIVIIVDEFADLMATTGRDLEDAIARITAMARAVGIHLVLATQRPSREVITGLIKANIPSRVAFMVTSNTDSRIIIDSPGAEKLLGQGDMLFTSSWNPYPIRMQGVFLSEEEVENICSYVKGLGEPEYLDPSIFEDEEETETTTIDFDEEDREDPLLIRALEIVVERKGASASYLQRRLKIGYNRAARLVEQMEEYGIIGPPNGSKPRELIGIPQEFLDQMN